MLSLTGEEIFSNAAFMDINGHTVMMFNIYRSNGDFGTNIICLMCYLNLEVIFECFNM